MTTTAKRILYWTPRILCMAFALFLGLFALDVFDGQHGFWEMVLGFIIHLLPSTLLVLVVLVFAWRREWIGAILFIVLSVLYIILGWGKVHWSAFAGISGPLFLIGILFYLNWRYRAELRAR